MSEESEKKASDWVVKVQAFEEKDFDRITELDRICFPDHLQFKYSKIRNILFDENTVVFTAKDRFEFITGYAILFLKKFEHEMILISLLVDPEFQNKKIGSYLLKFCEEFSKHMRVDKISAQVESSNQQALKLFEKSGFKTVETLQDYFLEGNQAFQMEKKIISA